jgi:hypothetical protein
MWESKSECSLIVTAKAKGSDAVSSSLLDACTAAACPAALAPLLEIGEAPVELWPLF